MTNTALKATLCNSFPSQLLEESPSCHYVFVLGIDCTWCIILLIHCSTSKMKKHSINVRGYRDGTDIKATQTRMG